MGRDVDPEADAMVECPNCAFRNQDSDGFCGSCGLFLWPEAYAGVGGAAAAAASAKGAPAHAGGRPAAIPSGRRPEGGAPGAPVPCRACGRPNTATRRFCGHCGTSLARASTYGAEPVPSAPTVTEPWWRRFLWWRRKRALAVHRAGSRPDRRAEREPWDPGAPAAKQAAPGRRALRWLRRTWRRIWPDVFLVLLILTLIALLFPDARRAVVDRFRDEPVDFLAPRFCVEPGQQGDSLAQYPPAFACDREPGTFWATSLGGDTGSEQVVRKRNPRLWIDFPTKVDLHEFHITAAEIPLAELSSELLRDSGRPAQICIKLYDTVAHRDEHYQKVAEGRPTTPEVRQRATIAVPPGQLSTSSNCAELKVGGEGIDDDPEEHRFTFAVQHGVEAVSIEFRRTHPTQGRVAASNVYTTGIEFFGKPVEEPEPEDGGS